MSFRFLRIRARALTGSLSLALLFSPVSAFSAPDVTTVAVNVDQAKLVKLPGRIATIVVGNPLIADVALQPGGLVVVTGKGYGATNFIGMDRSGEILVDRIIQVEGPSEQLVTVYRGIERESYSCKPMCQKRITLGDGEGYFRSTMEQANTLSGQAAGNAAAAAGKPAN